MGAGPAGLATAAVLRQQGIRPTVLEQSDDVGGSWPGRWDSLRLHTMRSLSGLPDRAIPRSYGRWVSRDDLVRYLRDYAEHFEIAPEYGVRVDRVDRGEHGWLVHTSGGVRESEIVIVATGYSRVPVIPDWPGRDDFAGPVTHTQQYRDPAPYRGRRVLVVGTGNSATEIATELAAHAASVQLSVRTPPNIVRRSSFGVPSQLVGVSMKGVPEPVLNPMSGLLRRLTVPDLSEYGLPAPGQAHTKFLRTRTIPVLDHGFVEQVRAGRIEIVTAVQGFTADDVELVDGTRLRPDAVIAGTGFSPGLESIVGHLGVLDEHGVPLVTGGKTLPVAPGLHFVGVFAVLSGVLHEIKLDARAVGKALAG